MSDRLKRLAWGAGVVSLLFMAGCGSPDLAAMKPTTTKPATFVVLVNQPTFVKSSQFTLPVSESIAAYDVLNTTTQSLLKQTKKVLSTTDVTTCMVVGDNLTTNMSDINTLLTTYPKVHFELISKQGVNKTASNLMTVEQNEEAIEYSIGWLVGTWASQSTSQPPAPQPTIGFVPGTLSANAQKAFFAGLFTIDPAATVIPMLPTSSGATGTPSTYPTVGTVVLGGPPDASLTQMLANNSIPLFALTTNASSLHPLIQPGSFDSSEVVTLFQNLATGHWQSGDEQVIGTSSLTINASALPASVATTWTALESSVSNQPDIWQTNFQQLPQNILQLLRSEFGIA